MKFLVLALALVASVHCNYYGCERNTTAPEAFVKVVKEEYPSDFSSNLEFLLELSNFIGLFEKLSQENALQFVVLLSTPPASMMVEKLMEHKPAILLESLSFKKSLADILWSHPKDVHGLWILKGKMIVGFEALSQDETVSQDLRTLAMKFVELLKETQPKYGRIYRTIEDLDTSGCGDWRNQYCHAEIERVKNQMEETVEAECIYYEEIKEDEYGTESSTDMTGEYSNNMYP